MFDSLFGMGNICLTSAVARKAGASGEPAVEVWGGNPRYTTYPTRDGKKVAICLLEAKVWRRFCEVIGRSDLIFDDERSSDRMSNHVDRSDLYRNALSQYCMALDRDHFGAQLADLDRKSTRLNSSQ